MYMNSRIIGEQEESESEKQENSMCDRISERRGKEKREKAKLAAQEFRRDIPSDRTCV